MGVGIESRSIELSQKPSAKRVSQWPIMYLIRFRWACCTGVGGGQRQGNGVVVGMGMGET
jgi:hypothetical protein